MDKRVLIPLSPRICRWMTRSYLAALLLVLIPAFTQAEEDRKASCQDYNKNVRTKSWSIYVQGGISRSSDIWYPSINASDTYPYSPAVGGGVDFTIRPWVRVGAEYIWSRNRREQNYSTIDDSKMPIKTYGNYLMNYHNVKLGADFNILQLWPNRRNQRFNIWLGTGVGYTTASGNEYAIWFNNTTSQNGTSTPIVGDVTIDNNSSISIQGNVTTSNIHSSYDKFYLPLSIQFEFDLCNKVTLGAKGEMDWIFNRGDYAPKQMAFGLVTLRYNFVPSRGKVMAQKYAADIDALNSRIAKIMQQAEDNNARAEQAEADRARAEQEKADLQRKLDECRQSKHVVAEKPTYTVQFDHNSSILNKEASEALKAFVAQYKGKQLSLVAEASTPGTKEYNQHLSERRLARVVKVLKEAGFADKDLKPSIAIGAQRGIDSAEARRVTITVE